MNAGLPVVSPSSRESQASNDLPGYFINIYQTDCVTNCVLNMHLHFYSSHVSYVHDASWIVYCIVLSHLIHLKSIGYEVQRFPESLGCDTSPARPSRKLPGAHFSRVKR